MPAPGLDGCMEIESAPTDKPSAERHSLYARPPEAIVEFLKAGNHPRFRADQILDWIYRKRVFDPMEMANLPLEFRQWLGQSCDFQPLELVLGKRSSDTTNKLLFRCADGSLIETVLIRASQEGVGLESSRKTLCISTQVGCAYGCRFCASGLAGWKRDLTAAEILFQFLETCRLEARDDEASRRSSNPLDNLVVMGMGEPLANYDNLMAALHALNADWGVNFGARRITVSTSGLVPQIERLADEPIGLRLAVSLHGATNAVRERIMPINRKYPLEQLLPAIQRFSERHGRMVTLEFILIESVNDHLEEAEELATIARDLHAHVNLIPYNTVAELDWKRPSLTRQQRFVECLRRRNVSVTLRREKGHAIEAACGQLRLKHERAAGQLESVPPKRSISDV